MSMQLNVWWTLFTKLIAKFHINHCQASYTELVIEKQTSLAKSFDGILPPCENVFSHGFHAHRHGHHGNHDKTFYNLHDYVTARSGRPLDSRHHSKFAFISTTVSNSWFPYLPYDSLQSGPIDVYRYEIYAPGGIWVGVTLGDQYCCEELKRLDQVAFVEGIAPQYIRSAELFRFSALPDRTTKVEKVENALLINTNFNPQSSPLRLLNIENPTSYFINENGEKEALQLRFYPNNQDNTPQAPPTSDPNPIDWYARGVVDVETYLDTAFRSSRLNEAYYIQKNVCTLVDYAPGGTEDKILAGPSFIAEMFTSLKFTPFGENGIDCSFASHTKDEAFIFCANLCALMNYAPHTTDDSILKGPMTITQMFPFFKGTVFENGIDSEFETTTEYEAYLFKGDQCAHINYGSDAHLIVIGSIGDTFSCLKGTIFESGIGAAYASHLKDEAYLFRNNNYGRLNFAQDQIVGNIGQIGSNGPGIASLFPHQNHNLDVRSDALIAPSSPGDCDQDELLKH